MGDAKGVPAKFDDRILQTIHLTMISTHSTAALTGNREKKGEDVHYHKASKAACHAGAANPATPPSSPAILWIY